ncbi:MAG: hypothetical protein AB1489_31625 [Acidobacteriota bacterium]
MQFEAAPQLFATIAIMSIVALRLIDLRERLRLHPNAPASHSGFDKLELEILRLKLERPIFTVEDVVLAVGQLGGHLNRNSDGMPGWQTLHRGMIKLRALVEGARSASKLNEFG